jgi:hypothetical protein
MTNLQVILSLLSLAAVGLGVGMYYESSWLALAAVGAAYALMPYARTG